MSAVEGRILELEAQIRGLLVTNHGLQANLTGAAYEIAWLEGQRDRTAPAKAAALQEIVIALRELPTRVALAIASQEVQEA